MLPTVVRTGESGFTLDTSIMSKVIREGKIDGTFSFSRKRE